MNDYLWDEASGGGPFETGSTGDLKQEKRVKNGLSRVALIE
jgi:hypothetical protein